MSKLISEMTDKELLEELGETGLPEENSEELENNQEELEDDSENLDEDSEEDSEEQSEEGSLEPDPEEGLDWKTEAEKLKEENEKLKKEKENREPIIGRQGEELGSLRKKMEELQQQINFHNSPEKLEEINDKFIENPYEASLEVAKREREIEEKRIALQRLQKEEYTRTNAEVVRKVIPNFEDLKEDIATVLREDKIEENIIKDVMNDIYFEQPAILIQLGKRAELSRKNRELEAILNKEKGKSDRILDNVAKTAQTSTLSGKTTTGTTNNTSITDMDIGMMNHAEITEVYERLFKKK